MVWLEKNVNFEPKKLGKDYFLMKFGWNFKFYTSGHPVPNHSQNHSHRFVKEKSNLLTFLSSSPTLKPYNWKNP